MGRALGVDNRYRYRLRRDTGEGKSRVCWVMLNPSTADEQLDDQTIRKVVSFSRGFGFRRVEVVNLFAIRATDPKDLLTHRAPVGPQNVYEIDNAMAISDEVIFAWGAWWHSNRHKMRSGARINVEEIAKRHGHKPMCLGKTKFGQPRHPCYLSLSTPLERY